MVRSGLRILIAALLFGVLFSGVYLSVGINSDFGKLEVRAVSVKDSGKQLSGLLYRPTSATPEKPTPAVVIAHGISESKDMMSNIGLELAKRGLVVLCLDLIGHGQSDGTVEEGSVETDFGVSAAVHFLQSQAYVNASAIGLVGHSLGAGAVRAAAEQDKAILAVVLVGGGLESSAQGPEYGTLNATFPRNLLVIVGEYDVLFNATDLQNRELLLAFNCPAPIVPGVTYGSFDLGVARELLIPATTHLFEMVDPGNVAQVVGWMQKSLKPIEASLAQSNLSLSYTEREVALLFALIGLLGISLISYYPLARLLSMKSGGERFLKSSRKSKSKFYFVWFFLNLVLFFPMVLIGFAISFPPLIFGSSIAWWVLATGSFGIFLFAENKPKFFKTKPNLKKILLESFSKKGIAIALGAFAILLGVSSIIQALFFVNLRILAPIFQEFTQMRRVLAFAAFVPFFLVYFLAEGLYLHGPQNAVLGHENIGAKIAEWAKVVSVKVSPFLFIIALQYLPKLIFNTWLLPSFLGFIAEFVWLITPIFVVSTTCSFWFDKKTGAIGTGTVFNVLMLSWIAAIVFPF